ncbi:MAG: GNAT family N-acetyltransferase [Phycisphaeraceae bacterium]|nr:GNAT family N-acetyltransferase [Phycisphaeraceae bacterium]
MELENFDPRYLEPMTALFNGMTEGQTRMARLEPGDFAALVSKKSYFDPGLVWVAKRGGDVLGWIHAAVTGPSEHWYSAKKVYARISMLVFPPGDVAVGAALVERALAQLRAAGHERILAMHCDGGYPFYRGLYDGGEPMCPAELAHLHMAFGYCGCKLTHESITKLVEMPRRPKLIEPKVKAEFVERTPPEMERPVGRESWTGLDPRVTVAIVDGQEAGMIGWVVQPHLMAKLGQPEMSIYMLGVGASFQRQGLAGALVTRALAAAYERGARSGTVGSEIGNPAAHHSYEKAGFRPLSITMGREWNAARSGE